MKAPELPAGDAEGRTLWTDVRLNRQDPAVWLKFLQHIVQQADHYSKEDVLRWHQLATKSIPAQNNRKREDFAMIWIGYAKSQLYVGELLYVKSLI